MDFMASEQQSELGLSIQVVTDWIMENHYAGCLYNLVLVNYSASFAVFCCKCTKKIELFIGVYHQLQNMSTGTLLISVFLDSECYLTCIYVIVVGVSSLSLFFSSNDYFLFCIC